MDKNWPQFLPPKKTPHRMANSNLLSSFDINTYYIFFTGYVVR